MLPERNDPNAEYYCDCGVCDWCLSYISKYWVADTKAEMED